MLFQVTETIVLQQIYKSAINLILKFAFQLPEQTEVGNSLVLSRVTT